jgi:hypothetical protein
MATAEAKRASDRLDAAVRAYLEESSDSLFASPAGEA